MSAPTDGSKGDLNESPARRESSSNSGAGSRTPTRGQVGSAVKSQHRIEGKNRKSLHQKQQANLNKQQSGQKQTQLTSSPTASNDGNTSNQSTSSNRRVPKSNSGLPGNKLAPLEPSNSAKAANSGHKCSTLEDFSRKALEIKADINKALEKQAAHCQNSDQPVEVVKLKQDILKLSGLEQKASNSDQKQENSTHQNKTEPEKANAPTEVATEDGKCSSHDSEEIKEQESSKESSNDFVDDDTTGYKSDVNLNQALDKLNLCDKQQQMTQQTSPKSSKLKKRNQVQNGDSESTNEFQQETNQEPNKQPHNNNDNDNNHNQPDGFEPLMAKLDSNSKVIALVSSLQTHFNNDSPHLIESVCRKLVDLSEQRDQLADNLEKYQMENQKLLSIKQKLENLCRELQKSNNAIRIESLDLIKVEQSKAKDQTTKIQSTLSGVIKLFDENQQRNMSLRQENLDLQTKLKSLLDHCDNWEKSVEAALRQRDIENRLIKTELAKANLLKNEEKEKFLGEKQELLRILSMMQEQQHRIEGQEAKLRLDLSSYASKYDECQAVISKGMNRFQTESKKMLKQIEKSKQDYKVLLSKYESSNRRMSQLLEEKQFWDRAMSNANKKILTLEKLCRALKERKHDDGQSTPTATSSASNVPKSIIKTTTTTTNSNTSKSKNKSSNKLGHSEETTSRQQEGPADATEMTAAAAATATIENKDHKAIEKATVEALGDDGPIKGAASSSRENHTQEADENEETFEKLETSDTVDQIVDG